MTVSQLSVRSCQECIAGGVWWVRNWGLRVFGIPFAKEFPPCHLTTTNYELTTDPTKKPDNDELTTDNYYQQGA